SRARHQNNPKNSRVRPEQHDRCRVVPVARRISPPERQPSPDRTNDRRPQRCLRKPHPPPSRSARSKPARRLDEAPSRTLISCVYSCRRQESELEDCPYASILQVRHVKHGPRKPVRIMTNLPVLREQLAFHDVQPKFLKPIPIDFHESGPFGLVRL